jgi:hypothetical protein
LSGQHPKLKLQNMYGGELKTGDMSPCQNTTMRALWRTTSASHYLECKVWILRSFNQRVFFCFLCLCFEGFMAFKGGTSYYFFKEGDYKNYFTRRGVPLSDPTPSFLYPPPPRFAKEFDLPTCAGRDFLT